MSPGAEDLVRASYILGIPKSATDKDIKKAYYQVSKWYHFAFILSDVVAESSKMAAIFKFFKWHRARMRIFNVNIDILNMLYVAAGQSSSF